VASFTPTMFGTSVASRSSVSASIVHADRPFLRYLTPIMRPIFRWNHNWSAARAKEGLEPYARA